MRSLLRVQHKLAVKQSVMRYSNILGGASARHPQSKTRSPLPRSVQGRGRTRLVPMSTATRLADSSRSRLATAPPGPCVVQFDHHQSPRAVRDSHVQSWPTWQSRGSSLEPPMHHRYRTSLLSGSCTSEPCEPVHRQAATPGCIYRRVSGQCRRRPSGTTTAITPVHCRC